MAPKIQIPDELKKDLPPSQWGKILVATPIVMTVIATMLAGLASSEMTRAQYDRASAAQLQSKAGDQWSYYQAKKLRSAVAHNTLDLLAATSDVKPLDAVSYTHLDVYKRQIKNVRPDKCSQLLKTEVSRLADGRWELEELTTKALPCVIVILPNLSVLSCKPNCSSSPQGVSAGSCVSKNSVTSCSCLLYTSRCV